MGFTCSSCSSSASTDWKLALGRFLSSTVILSFIFFIISIVVIFVLFNLSIPRCCSGILDPTLPGPRRTATSRRRIGTGRTLCFHRTASTCPGRSTARPRSSPWLIVRITKSIISNNVDVWYICVTPSKDPGYRINQRVVRNTSTALLDHGGTAQLIRPRKCTIGDPDESIDWDDFVAAIDAAFLHLSIRSRKLNDLIIDFFNRLKYSMLVFSLGSRSCHTIVLVILRSVCKVSRGGRTCRWLAMVR